MPPILLLAGFCLFYAVDGVFRERKYEVYAYIVGILVVLGYILIDLIFANDNRTILKWVSTVYFSSWNLSYTIGYAFFSLVLRKLRPSKTKI